MHRAIANCVRKILVVLSFAVALSAMCHPAMAQSTPWIQQAELTASDGGIYNDFGFSVAISGSTALIGTFNKGSAYVFAQSGGTWSQQAELAGSDEAPGDEFGASVAVAGSTAVIGSSYHQVGSNSRQGAAYVFVQSGTTWTQQAELTASDGQADDYFGTWVAVSGNIALVGAPSHTVGSNSAQGAVYVFVQSGTTWTQQAELTASDGAADAYFGEFLSLSGDTAAIAGGGYAYGNVYVFVQSDGVWTQQQEMTGGYGAVAVDGSTLLAASNESNGFVGEAYVFAQSGTTWSQQAELTGPSGIPWEGFGWSVDVDSGTALAGAAEIAFGSEGVNNGPGAAYVFAQSGTTWSQQAALAASDGNPGDFFGYSVAVGGSTAVVGAVNHQVGSNQEQGAVYVYTSSGPLYTLAANPSTLSLVQGTQGTSTISITPFNGFSGNVSFSVYGLPNGVSAAFSTNPATSTTTLTLTASETATTGTETVLVVGASGNLTQTTPMTLTVTGVTTVSLTPASLTFSKQAVNTTSTSKEVTLKNTGTATLDIGSIGLALGTNFAISKNTCTSTLNVGKTCTVRVTFTPTKVGELSDTLTFTDNASGNPQGVPVSGDGVVQAALTPASFRFIDTEVGATTTHIFTLKNNLPSTLTDISYSTAAPFAVSASTCTGTLTSGKGCTISVTFSPTSEETYNGTLTVTDSANNSPQTASLSGTGD
jgi:hypothetical protein